MPQARELPEVITADMLRARMAERKKVVMDEDFEIPAELLAGLEEIEAAPDEEEWDERAKASRRVKPKASSRRAKVEKKKPAKKRYYEADDEVD